MTIREEREEEIDRFKVTVYREFPDVTFHMAKDTTRGGRTIPSTTRLICTAQDYSTRNAIQKRFGNRMPQTVSECALSFQF